MLDRFGKEIDFSEMFMEETLSAKDRKELDDSMYGIVYTDENGKKVRKYPLNDEKHVLQAVRFFNKAEEKYKPELARKIVKRAKELDMDYSGWDVLKPYLNNGKKNVQEGFLPDPDSTSGTSEFDDNDHEPDDCYCEYKSSLKDVKLSKIEHLYFWSSVLLESDDDTSGIQIDPGDRTKLFVTDKLGLCPFYTLYDQTVFENINEKYDADIFPVFPRDLDSLSDKEDITIKVKSDNAKHRSGEFTLYVYEVDKTSVSVIERDKKYKTDYLYLIPRRNGNIKISSKPIKTSHVKYSIIPELPIKESFEDIFGPVIQEAFDAVTGEEIPIDKAYTLEEMKARSYTDKDVIIPVKKPSYDELYFGTPVNYMPEIDLQGPLFVTPFKGLASIFTGREKLKEELRKRGIRRYNLDYKEWDAPEKDLVNPLKEVHVYVEPYPELEPFVLEDEGYIHCIKTKDYENNFYRYPWMNDREYLIAKTDNMKVEFTRVIKCKIKYIVSGRMSGDNDFNKVSDDPLKWAENISKEISSQVKKDEKPHVGNQNCQLCSWCVEASFRGWLVMPRPVYSPRDPIFTVKGEDIVIGTKRERVTSFDDLDDKLRDAGRSLARWYCHVNWRDSKGGHEFIILKITDTRNTPHFFIVDAQVGKVERLSASHEYFRDINWSTSYIARLDKYEFNRKMFTKMNDPSKIIPWDEKKDIAFMIREGMVSKEEAEAGLKKKSAFEIAMSKPVQEGVFDSLMKKDDNPSPHGLLIDGISHEEFDKVHGENHNFDELFSLYENSLFVAAISNFNKAPAERHYSNTFAKVAERIYDEADADKYGAIIEGFVNDIIPPTNLYTFRNKSSFGIVFAEAGGYGNDVFIVSGKDGKVYYMLCDDPEYLVSEDIKTFLKSFDTTIFNGCLEQHVQESATSESLFKQLPKDLQGFLEKRDFSGVDKDYGIDGYDVEQFFKPEFIITAGESYDLKNDDKFYNAIDFATDGGGNDFVYLPTDGYYYSLDHEVYDENDHIHGDKLSSRKWSDLLDPNHVREFDNNERRIASIEYRNLVSEGVYGIICKIALAEDELTNIECNSFKESYDYLIRKTKWVDKISDFSLKYKCSYLNEAITKLMDFMQHSFIKFLRYDKNGLKNRCIEIVAAFIRVKKELGIDSSQCPTNIIKTHKAFINKYEKETIQESAIGEILNGVNPFSNKRVFHISQDGHLDGQVFKPRVPEYLDKYDPSQDKFEDVENPRVCFSPSIEGCLNAIMVTIGRWKTAEKLREWYVYVPEKPLKEYKHRTNKQLIKEKKVYDANVTDEIWIEEPVRLKQYGIIRIDQVSSKSIKDTVPTTKGFTGHRYKYSFKWHWLVKPKVIADLPYDYSPKEVCKDMIADMEKFKYGLAENGTVHSASAHDYDTKYRLQSPEEFEQNGGGICYDYVEFMEGYLNAYGYDCKKYFISTNTADNDTHTFLLVRDGKGWKDGFIYPESSFKLMEGVYEVKNYEEAALKIMDKIFDVNHNGEKYDEIKYYVWEYSGHPPYGSDMKTCMEYFSKGDPIHEGTAMKLKRKD